MREVDLAVDLEVLLLLGREDPVEQLLRNVGRQRRDVLERLQLPAHAYDRVRGHGDVQIGRVPRHHLLQEIVDRVREVRHGRFVPIGNGIRGLESRPPTCGSGAPLHLFGG
jgi:hypothetical protein